MFNLSPQLALDAQDPQDHPAQETRARHRRDDLLRSNGYEIHQRPKCGEALWRHRQDGAWVIVTEAEAVAQVTGKKGRRR